MADVRIPSDDSPPTSSVVISAEHLVAYRQLFEAEGHYNLIVSALRARRAEAGKQLASTYNLPPEFEVNLETGEVTWEVVKSDV